MKKKQKTYLVTTFSFFLLDFCFVANFLTDLLDVGTLLRIGRQHVVHQRPQVLGVLGGHGGELPLDDLAREAVEAGRPPSLSSIGLARKERRSRRLVNYLFCFVFVLFLLFDCSS